MCGRYRAESKKMIKQSIERARRNTFTFSFVRFLAYSKKNYI